MTDHLLSVIVLGVVVTSMSQNGDATRAEMMAMFVRMAEAEREREVAWLAQEFQDAVEARKALD